MPHLQISFIQCELLLLFLFLIPSSFSVIPICFNSLHSIELEIFMKRTDWCAPLFRRGAFVLFPSCFTIYTFSGCTCSWSNRFSLQEPVFGNPLFRWLFCQHVQFCHLMTFLQLVFMNCFYVGYAHRDRVNTSLCNFFREAYSVLLVCSDYKTFSEQ